MNIVHILYICTSPTYKGHTCMGYISQLRMSSVEWNAACPFPEEKPALVALPALHFLGQDSTTVTHESHLPHHLHFE